MTLKERSSELELGAAIKIAGLAKHLFTVKERTVCLVKARGSLLMFISLLFRLFKVLLVLEESGARIFFLIMKALLLFRYQNAQLFLPTWRVSPVRIIDIERGAACSAK